MENNSSRLSGVAKWLLICGLILVANSAYVAAFGEATFFYVANSLLHPFLGIASAILLGVFVRRHRDLLSGGLGALTRGFLALAVGFGIYILFVGMTRAHSRALYAHVAASIVAVFLLLVILHARARREGSGELIRRAWRWSMGVAVCAGAFYLAAITYQRLVPNPQYVIHNPSMTPLTMEDEGGGPSSLAFPSSARTLDGKPIDPKFFMHSEDCKPCHKDIYDQWQSSMHHMASFNNQWYRKAIEYMQDVDGIKPSIWCGGCHDHALVFSNMMQNHPIREIEHSPQGQIGLGCMSCHSIVHVGSTMGQGNFVIEYPFLDRIASSQNPVLRTIADFAIKLNPKPHRNVFLKPFHKDPAQVPEFCSTCHKVHLDVPVNNYRWIRGFNDYDNWQASGVSGQGARSFYYPPKPQQCADCHMPLVPSQDFGNINGQVHSHRFAAANTAVPTSYHDKDQIAAVEKFLRGAVTVDIFALAQEPGGASESAGPAAVRGESPQLSSSFAVGEESSAGMSSASVSAIPVSPLVAPLGRVNASVRRGDTVRVEVVVRTRKVGHFFPGGTVDAFDCWVELEGHDSHGRTIFWSGKAADDGHGPVETGAHFYRSLQLDAHGNPINKRNAWSTRATMYAHLIPPGAADTVHFRLKIPADCGDQITLTAKLNYRKFAWWDTQWAFAGVRDPNDPHPDVAKDHDDGKWLLNGSLKGVSAAAEMIPDVPTVVMSQNTVTIPVLAKSAPAFAEKLALDPKDRERWNDYGIGLLLQGDLKGAERAFEEVTQLEPGYANGWVNGARARILEGNTDAAKPMLEKALSLDPQLASAHYFRGLAYKTDGDYPRAYEDFAAAAALYPRDRVVRNQMGRMLFLQRKYADAVAELQKTLAVDPEDLEAHYNLMLCYRGLNNDDLASREEQLYMRFKADESSRAITGPFKLTHPDDNNESLPVHEHVSIALGPEDGGKPKPPGSKQYAEGAKQKAESARQRAEGNVKKARNSVQSAGARQTVAGGPIAENRR
jgi:tetratricopeptide (TPR) repeat protein